nr:male specific lethal 3 1 [Hymenolepis microstoma]
MSILYAPFFSQTALSPTENLRDLINQMPLSQCRRSVVLRHLYLFIAYLDQTRDFWFTSTQPDTPAPLNPTSATASVANEASAKSAFEDVVNSVMTVASFSPTQTSSPVGPVVTSIGNKRSRPLDVTSSPVATAAPPMKRRRKISMSVSTPEAEVNGNSARRKSNDNSQGELCIVNHPPQHMSYQPISQFVHLQLNATFVPMALSPFQRHLLPKVIVVVILPIPSQLLLPPLQFKPQILVIKRGPTAPLAFLFPSRPPSHLVSLFHVEWRHLNPGPQNVISLVPQFLECPFEVLGFENLSQTHRIYRSILFFLISSSSPSFVLPYYVLFHTIPLLFCVYDICVFVHSKLSILT